MTDHLQFESRLEERLRARAALASRPFDAAAIAREAVAVNGRRRRLGRLEWPSRRPALGWMVMALLLAIALLGAVAGVGELLRQRSLLIQPDPVPAEQMTVIRQVFDAVNGRDVGSLRTHLGADAIVVLPHLSSDGRHEVAASDRSVSEEGFLEVWLGGLGAWDMEADLRQCRVEAASTIRCDVATRWHVLQVEIGEEWAFGFEAGELTQLEMSRVDPNPMDRILSLGYDDLRSWESWLEATHPDQAAGLAGDNLIWNFYFRYHPSNADAIGSSIEEYLESRDPLVGTYVCSEDGNPDVTHLWEVREDGTITRASGETGDALPAGTWSRDNGRLLTNFEGGMTWFAIQGDRLVIQGGWACTPGSSR